MVFLQCCVGLEVLSLWNVTHADTPAPLLAYISVHLPNYVYAPVLISTYNYVPNDVYGFFAEIFPRGFAERDRTY